MYAQEITDFLSKNDEYIFQEHLKMLKDFKEELLEEEHFPRVKSIHGRHRSNCVWAKDNCRGGPDTCECVFFDFRLGRIEEIISMYNKIFSKMNQMFKY